MTTGQVESWGGTVTDIGPMYPFVGWEMLLTLVLLVFWVGWHILQLRTESREFKDDERKLHNKEVMTRVLNREG
ncbi:MAG: hypothetical protein R3F45_11770 [Gammaproteobacteria bacterium]